MKPTLADEWADFIAVAKLARLRLADSWAIIVTASQPCPLGIAIRNEAIQALKEGKNRWEAVVSAKHGADVHVDWVADGNRIDCRLSNGEVYLWDHDKNDGLGWIILGLIASVALMLVCAWMLVHYNNPSGFSAPLARSEKPVNCRDPNLPWMQKIDYCRK